MSFFRRNKAFIISFIAVWALGSIFFFEGTFRSTMTNVTRSTTASVWRVAHSTREAFNSYGGISSRRALAEENKKLREEISRLQSLSLHNDVLRAENATLRDMFSLREAHPEGVAAPVLSNPSVSPYGTFVIGAGTIDGIETGSYVISSPRVAIGQVLEADLHTSLVGLFSAPGEKNEVIINKIRVSYVGRGDGNGLIVVPRGISIKEGEAIRFAGQPFAIGFVGFVSNDPEDAETKVLVRVPVNLPSLSFVYVVPAPK